MRFGIVFGKDPEKTCEPKLWISFLSFEYLVTHLYCFAECVTSLTKFTWTFNLDRTSTHLSIQPPVNLVSPGSKVWLHNCAEPADLAKAIPLLQQKIIGMQKKRTETGSLIDQQVWNTDGLRDNKRPALGKGTGTTFPMTSRILPCIELYHVLPLIENLSLSGLTARTEDIQEIVSILQNK